MVHSFKYGGYRFAYDTVSGTLFRFDELTYKMLDYIGLPMPVDCPSALRYDLAKYDSMAIDDAYDALYALSKEGKIFVPEMCIRDSMRGQGCRSRHSSCRRCLQRR